MKKNLLFVFIFLSFSSQAFAKVHFEKKSILVGNKKIIVEIAQTIKQQGYGLMHRTKLGKNNGMLFIFEEERPLSFWMKDTLIPLTIGYFDKNRILIETFDMTPAPSSSHKPIASYTSSKPAKYALEMNLGWFKKNQIKIGDKLILD